MNTVKVRNLELGNGIPAICIPNIGKTKEEILSLTKNYLSMHMDLMEWRMDWFEDVEDIDKVTALVKSSVMLWEILHFFVLSVPKKKAVYILCP